MTRTCRLPADEDVLRIVSLCPSITETLFAIGAGSRIVGITSYCIHPEGGVGGVPRVGGTKNPRVPVIRQLKPDLIFANAEENRANDIALLSSEFPVDISHPRTAAEVPDLLRHFGSRTGCEPEASRLAADVEWSMRSLSGTTLRAFWFAYLVWKDPWMVAGPETYISNLVSLAGGRNVVPVKAAPAATDYPTVTLDELRNLAPEVVLLPDEPFRFGEEHLRSLQRELPGVCILPVSGDDFGWHGVRTLRGLEASLRVQLQWNALFNRDAAADREILRERPCRGRLHGSPTSP